MSVVRKLVSLCLIRLDRQNYADLLIINKPIIRQTKRSSKLS